MVSRLLVQFETFRASAGDYRVTRFGRAHRRHHALIPTYVYQTTKARQVVLTGLVFIETGCVTRLSGGGGTLGFGRLAACELRLFSPSTERLTPCSPKANKHVADALIRSTYLRLSAPSLHWTAKDQKCARLSITLPKDVSLKSIVQF